ncbi:hypothetical protein IQ255_11065 [Pleurocapsales cyanobacterium LEGE 10410]|nr:hypothetical protein [Pleurocapsales cyanobacterium LEGE 10410]
MGIKSGFFEKRYNSTEDFSEREREIYNRAMKHYRYVSESYRSKTEYGTEVFADINEVQNDFRVYFPNGERFRLYRHRYDEDVYIFMLKENSN